MVSKPSEREEDYFARIEFERKKKLEEEKHKQLVVEEALKIYEEKRE